MKRFDIKQFLEDQKSLLIAPAGYGKTHTITNCLQYIENNKLGKHLILTHTHAGVASIKEKIAKVSISSKYFNVETITSFAQKYVLAFCTEVIPSIENTNEYYHFIIDKATAIFSVNAVYKILKNTYSGIFVDEYQDCTKRQNKLIHAISKELPIHILGDHMQGIFDFKEEIVDLKSDADMEDFLENLYELDKPWRWINSNAADLGDSLKIIRNQLESKQNIDLNDYNSIETIIINEKDLYKPRSTYFSNVQTLLNQKTLFIYPDSANKQGRLNLVKRFKFSMLESIDEKKLYAFALQIDNAKADIVKTIIVIFKELFNTTGIDNWFNDIGVKSKRKSEDKQKIYKIQFCMKQLNNDISLDNILGVFKEIKHLPGVICFRKDIYHSLCKAIEEAIFKKTTVYEEMLNYRDRLRRIGRNINGNCIGTTLLTKGLEFETVVIFNAHKFKNPKHLYVAFTRASKKLIVFSNSNILSPY